MKTLKEALFSRKNIKNDKNPFGLTEKDLIREIEWFPMGVVVRMLEEQKLQGNKHDVKIFQRDKKASKDTSGFSWIETVDGVGFWLKVINIKDFNLFFERYPEYEIYNL